MLNPKEINRYNRHLLLPEIGETGQVKLKNARVLVIGAGGLGCPALQYLAAAGAGTIGIVDYDNVELSNLQRQILYTDKMIGKNKAETAANRLSELNPLIHINKYPVRLTNQNALEIFEGYDLILDGTDNFTTRYLINDACLILKKPLVYASVYKFEGQLSVFHLTESSPTYRCLFPEQPSPENVPDCSETGILGVVPGIMGCLQASEAIKIITDTGQPLDGKLVCYNYLNQTWTTLSIQRNTEIVEKYTLSREEFITREYNISDIYCDLDKVKSITAKELMNKSQAFRIIDIREYGTEPDLDLKNVERIPLSTFSDFPLSLAEKRPIVFICQRGIKSSKLISDLQKKNPELGNLYNLEGGALDLFSIK